MLQGVRGLDVFSVASSTSDKVGAHRRTMPKSLNILPNPALKPKVIELPVKVRSLFLTPEADPMLAPLAVTAGTSSALVRTNGETEAKVKKMSYSPRILRISRSIWRFSRALSRESCWFSSWTLSAAPV